MDQKQILKFFLEQGLLVDKDILNLFSENTDFESTRMIIEKIKNQTHQKIITKEIFSKNFEKVSQFFLSLPEEKQKNFNIDKLKVKLGLSIEISKETFSQKENSPKAENPAFDEKKTVLSEGKPKVKVLYVSPTQKSKIEVEDFVKHFRSRFLELKNILQERVELKNLVSINKIFGDRQKFSIIGMVYDKKITKNKNIVLDLEDLTGKIRVVVNYDKKDLYEKADEVCFDSVIGVVGSGNREVLFANDIIFPDLVLPEKKKSPIEEHVAFISDLQFGSKKFFAKNFEKFIEYLNGKLPNTPEALKIKYLIIGGDLVAGVGNYPGQEKDLEIADLEEQNIRIAQILKKIRKDIQIIICPGNHEGVRLMEPQPVYDEKYAWPLYEMENVTLVENPSLVNIGARENFPGFDILLYHGFSYRFYANTVPRLLKSRAMNTPDEIIKYLLKNRHLAPTHNSVQYFPHEKDTHLIRTAPDIIFSGHIHKSAISYYNNVLIICGSSWEAKTAYQEKFGNEQDFCKVPVLNLKTRAIKILDFYDGINEEIK